MSDSDNGMDVMRPPTAAWHQRRVGPLAKLITLVLGIGSSLMGYSVLNHLNEQKVQGEFAGDAAQRIATWEMQLAQALEAMTSLEAFYDASLHVTTSEFDAFASHIVAHRPGIVALLWAPATTPSFPSPILNRSDPSSPDDGTSPNSIDGVVPNVTVRYSMGHVPAWLATGRVIGAEQTIAVILERARRRRALTAGSVLPVSSDGTPSNLLLLALPRFAPPSPSSEIIGGQSQPSSYLLGLYDMDAIARASRFDADTDDLDLIVRSQPATQLSGCTSNAANQPLTIDRRIPIADQNWQIEVTASNAYLTKRSNPLPMIVLWSGFFITLLAVAYLRMMAKHMRETKQYARAVEQANRFLRREIDDRHTAELSLRKSEARYRGLADMAFSGVLVLQDGTVIEANRALRETLGYNESELLGKPWSALVAANQPSLDDHGTSTSDNNIVESIALCKDGSELTVELCLKPLSDEGDNKRLVTLRDISDRKRLNEARARSQRLESLGTMAGGLAHDFNNLLMSMLGNVELSRMALTSPNELTRTLAEMESAILRASEITKRLLTFAKGGVPLRKPLDLSTIIREAAQMAGAGSHATVEISIAPGMPPVNGDAGQLSQVMHNLVLNAIQATLNPGVVRVCCEIVEVEDAGSNLDPGSYVRVTVADEGAGISEEALPHIFDPYFTTKEGGHGLGLATTYSIIQAHHGQICVTRSSPQGTEVCFWLPVFRGFVQASAEPSPDLSPQFSGHVLVMDDEEAIRRVIKKMLEKLGFTVTTCESGAQAVEAARAATEPSCLTVLDLTVPAGMGGVEALRHLRQLYPNLKAIVSSGYAPDSGCGDYAEQGFDGALQKPYTYLDLKEVLQEVLRNASRNITVA